MPQNTLKAMWKAGRPVVAGWANMADSYAAETMARAGFDALVLDMQHGMTIGPDRAGAWLQAVGTTATIPVVRVPWNEPAYVQWVLDAGAQGVIVPLVNSAAEAAKAARSCRYPPMGARSVGANRARFLWQEDYASRANDEVVCLVMIETEEAVENIDSIAGTPGIDGLYIGPMDLAMSLGVKGSYIQDERHASACRKTLDAARRKGLVAGIHCFDPQEAIQRFREGFMFCPITADVRLLSTGAAAALRQVKDAGLGGM